MATTVEPQQEKPTTHRHRKRTNWRRELEREPNPTDSKEQLLRIARDKVNDLKLKIGNSSYHTASIQRSMKDGKSFATAYQDTRAHVARLLKELQALHNDLGEGGSISVNIHDHHELEHLEDEAHHMERMAAFATVRAGVHILHHHHHDDHHVQGHQAMHHNLELLEHDLQLAERHPYPGVRTLAEMDAAVKALEPEMEAFVQKRNFRYPG